MATIEELMTQFAIEKAAGTSTVDTKQADVAKATANKQLAMMGQDKINQAISNAALSVSSLNDAGLATATGLEKNLIDMSEAQLISMYGVEQGTSLYSQLTEQLAQNQQNNTDLLNQGFWKKTGNLGVNTGQGITNFVTGTVGLSAQAGSKLSELAGLTTAAERGDFLAAYNENIVQPNRDMFRSIRSDTDNAAIDLSNQQQALNERDAEAAYQAAIAAGDNKYSAGAKQFGRDFTNYLDIIDTNPALTSQVGGEAIGMVGGIRGVSKLVEAGLNKAAGVTAAEYALAQSNKPPVVGVVNKLLEKATAREFLIPLAVGSSADIGSVAGEASKQIRDISFTQLKADPIHGERFTKRASEIGEEQARNELAASVADTVAVEYAPIVTLTSSLTARMEGGLGSRAIAKAAASGEVSETAVKGALATAGKLKLAGNDISRLSAGLLREPVEETIQESASKLLENAAIANQADSTQQLSEGVGTAGAAGAFGGLVTSGVVNPGKVTGDAAKAVGSSIVASNALLGEGFRVTNKGIDYALDKAGYVSPITTIKTALKQKSEERAKAKAERAARVDPNGLFAVHVNQNPEGQPVKTKEERMAELEATFDENSEEMLAKKAELQAKIDALFARSAARQKAEAEALAAGNNTVDTTVETQAEAVEQEELSKELEVVTAKEEKVRASREAVLDMQAALEWEVPPKGVGIPDNIVDALEGTTSVPQGLKVLTDLINNRDTDASDKTMALRLVSQITGELNDKIGAAPDLLNSLDEMPSLQEFVNTQVGNIQSIVDSTEIEGVKEGFTRLLGDMLANGLVHIPNKANLTNSNEQGNLDEILKIAATTNSEIPNELQNVILEMVDDKTITLSHKQRSSLQALAGEFVAMRAIQDTLKSLGHDKTTFVNRQISTNEDAHNLKDKSSLRERARRVTAAYLAGDNVKATKELNDLGDLVQHLNNKLTALNTNIENPGEAVHYQALNRTRQPKGQPKQKWSESKKGVYYNPNSNKSITTAKTIAAEQQMASTVFNVLQKAYGNELSVGAMVHAVPSKVLTSKAVQPTNTTKPVKEKTPADIIEEAVSEPVQEIEPVKQETQQNQKTETNKQSVQAATVREFAALVNEYSNTNGGVDAAILNAFSEETVAELRKKVNLVLASHLGKTGVVTRLHNALKVRETKDAKLAKQKAKTEPKAVTDKSEEDKVNKYLSDLYAEYTRKDKPNTLGSSIVNDMPPEMVAYIQSQIDKLSNKAKAAPLAKSIITALNVRKQNDNKKPDTVKQQTKPQPNKEVKQGAITDSKVVEPKEESIVTAKTEDTIEATQETNEQIEIEPEVITNTTTEATEAAVESEVKHTITSLFPNMIGDAKSVFYKAYKLPKKIKSRFTTVDNIADSFVGSLHNRTTLAEFLGSTTSDAKVAKFTPKVAATYKALIAKYNKVLYDGIQANIVVLFKKLRERKQGDKLTDKELAIFAYSVLQNNYQDAEAQKLVKKANITKQDLNNLSYLVKGKLAEDLFDKQDIAKARTAKLDSILNVKLQNLKKSLAADTKISLPMFGHLIGYSRYPQAKILHLLSTNAEGKSVIDPRFYHAVVLGVVSWIAKGNQGRYQTAEELAEAFSAEVDLFSAFEVALLNKSSSMTKATQTVTQNIKSILGISSNNEADIGYSQGIIGTLAANALRIIENNGDAFKDELSVVYWEYESDGEARKAKLFAFNEERHEGLEDYSDLIQVMTSPEYNSSFILGSDSKIPTAMSIANNPDLLITEQQERVLEAANDIEQKLNTNVLGMYSRLSEEGIVYLFGHGNLDEDNINKNDYASKAGKNLSLTSAWKTAQSLVANVKAYLVEHPEISMGDVAIKYAKEFNSINRMQQISANTNQSSKLIRQLVTPTTHTLNLLDKSSTEYKLYRIALAQGMGIKVHNYYYEDVEKQLTDKLSQKSMIRAMEILGKADKENTPFTEKELYVLKVASKHYDGTEWGLSSLLDVARFNANPDTHSNYTTSVAIEADGVTNGTANALQMLTGNEITEQDVLNWRRTGFLIGSNAKTMNEYRQMDKTDVYQSIADTLVEKIAEKKDRLLKSIRVPRDNSAGASRHTQRNLISFQKMYNFLYSLDMTIKQLDNGDIEITRNATKNPATITLYGSGITGIAENVVNAILEEIYERMSDIMQNGKKSKYFPTYNKMADNFRRITNSVIVQTIDSTFITGIKIGKNPDGTDKYSSFDLPKLGYKDSRELFKKYTVPRKAFGAMVQNITAIYVSPMNEAITSVYGESVKSNMARVINLGHIHNTIMVNRYRRYLTEAVNIKVKNNPLYVQTDFLSENELNRIKQQVITELTGIHKTDNQNLFFVSSNKTDDIFTAKSGLYAAADGTNATSPEINTMGTSKTAVGAAPKSVISMGDGSAIQKTIDAMVDEFGKSMSALFVYDGIEYSLADIMRGSEIANKAVFETWTENNPLAVLTKSFAEMLPKVKAEDLTEDLSIYLVKAKIILEAFDGEDKKFILSILTDYLKDSQEKAVSIQARQQVMRSLQVNVDQMAAVGSPYVHEGKTDVFSSTDAAVVAEELTAMIVEKEIELLWKGRYEPKEKVPKDVATVSEELDVAIRATSNAQKSGVIALSAKELGRTLDAANLTGVHRIVAKLLSTFIAASDVIVIYGTKDQLLQQFGKGKDTFSKAVTKKYSIKVPPKGAYFVDHNRIVLSVDDSEALLHELLHALTTKTIFSYFAGKQLQGNAKEAIQNLQIQLEEFLSDEFANKAFDINSDDIAVQEAKAKYESTKKKLLDYGKARQLSEFISYVLPNKQLYLGTSKVTTKGISNYFVRFIHKAFGYLKSMMFGNSTRMSTVESDTFARNFFVAMAANVSEIADQNTNAPSTATHTKDNVLDMTADEVTDLEKLNQSVTNLVNHHIASTSGSKKGTKAVATVIVKTNHILTQVTKAGFVFNTLESDTYKAIYQAMLLGLETNSNAIARVQEVFVAFVNNTAQDMFLKGDINPQTQHDSDKKYEAILGNFSRTTLTPTEKLANFIALARVSTEIQDKLKDIAVPKDKVASNDAFNNWVANVGNQIIDLAGNYATENVNSDKANDILNAMIDTAFEVEADAGMIEQDLQSSASKIDELNNILVDGIKAGTLKLGLQAIEGSKKVEPIFDPERTRSETPLGKVLEFGKDLSDMALQAIVNAPVAVLALSNSEVSSLVTKDIKSYLNKQEKFKPLQELANDFIGRHKGIANVYDLILPVKTAIAKTRQEYKQKLPNLIREAFTKQPTKDEWKVLYEVIGKTGVSVLGTSTALKYIADFNQLNQDIVDLEQKLISEHGGYARRVIEKAEQLSDYTMSGVPGNMLLRNAHAVSHLFGIPHKAREISPTFVSNVDKLISLYSLAQIDDTSKGIITQMNKTDKAALTNLMNYLQTLHKETKLDTDAYEMAKVNGYKGYLSRDSLSKASLVVASKKDYRKLLKMGYEYLGNYEGDSRDIDAKGMGYYFTNTSSKKAFNQGLLQNVKLTTNGVNVDTGFTEGHQVAGRILNPDMVEQILAQQLQGKSSENSAPLLPVFDSSGSVIAFERSIHVDKAAMLKHSDNLASIIGTTRGRQVEEKLAQEYNQIIVKALKENAVNSDDEDLVDVLDTEELLKDPVLKDAVGIIPDRLRDMIETQFGEDGGFKIKRELLNDVLGYRKASIIDSWTGISRFDEATQKRIVNAAEAILGEKAVTRLLTAENAVEEFVGLVKTAIVIKSVAVPAANALGNIVHLMSRGALPLNAPKVIARKVAELERYSKAQERIMELRANIYAEQSNRPNGIKQKQYQTELDSLMAVLNRMSIAPLIKAGQLSNINDMGYIEEDSLLFEGNLEEYVSKLVDKAESSIAKEIGTSVITSIKNIPEPMKIVGKHLFIARDTALFAGLQKSVIYGDFIAKAMLYDHLIKKGMNNKDAIVQITEEFVNYSLLPGRTRGKLEDVGLLWFYNYKLRISKVAINTMRSNPLWALMAVGGVGNVTGIDTGISDNALAQAIQGSLDYSMGIGMMSGIASNPYAQVLGIN